MSFAFNERFSNSRRTIHADKMAELTPDQYQELLRFQNQETSYFNNPISLESYRKVNHFKVA